MAGGVQGPEAFHSQTCSGPGLPHRSATPGPKRQIHPVPEARSAPLFSDQLSSLHHLIYSSLCAGKWKPNDYPFVDNVRAIYLTLEKLIQPEATQVNGVVILADYSGVGMSQASNPGPFLAKKVVSILQVRRELTDLNGLRFGSAFPPT